MNVDEHCREVYANAGLALYKAQCLEMELTNFYIILCRFNSIPITRMQIEGIENEVNRKTLGQLLKDFKRIVQLQESDVKQIDDALRLRNKLAHTFFKDNALMWMTEDNREKMINDLRKIINELEIVDVLVSATVKAMSKAAGIDGEKIQKEYDELIKK